MNNHQVKEYAQRHPCCMKNMVRECFEEPCGKCSLASSPKPAGYTTVHRGCGGDCQLSVWTIQPHYYHTEEEKKEKKKAFLALGEEEQKAEVRKTITDGFWHHVLKVCEGPPNCLHC